MQQLFSAHQTKEYEGHLMKSAGVPSLLLMEYAALAVSKAALSHLPKRVLVISGYGNNGADGLAAARILKCRGTDSDILLIGNPDHATPEWKVQSEICAVADIDIYTDIDKCRTKKHYYDVVIDALLGIGSSRELKGEYLEAVRFINENKEADNNVTVISVDVPTGIHPDSGIILGNAIRADETVTFFNIKTGLLLGKGREYCGKITVIDPMPLSGIKIPDFKDKILAVDETELIKVLKRDKTGNKGTFGKVLCVSGSKNMPGACILNARAAFSAGAGMVKVLSNEDNRDLLINEMPEAMFASYNSITDDELQKIVSWCDSVVIGCGLGTDEDAVDLFRRTVGIASASDKNLIIDADGLNVLSKDISILKDIKSTVVLTPHPGEWKRLFPESAAGYNDPVVVKELAAKYNCIIVAKDATTIISDGNDVYLNMSGNDGMATAGSGDVLAGITVALMAARNPEKDIVKIASAVYLHGVAGDLASEKAGNVSLTASCITEELPNVILSLNRSEK